MLSNLGELFFTIAIGYMGAIEFLFMVKHLYHWSFQHHQRLSSSNEDSLIKLQSQIQRAIDEEAKKKIQGYQRMKDGVFYKDGFRIDPNADSKDKDAKIVNQREIIGKITIDEKSTENDNLTNVSEKLISTTNQENQQVEVKEEIIVEKKLAETLSAVPHTPSLTEHIKESYEQEYGDSAIDEQYDNNERNSLTQTVKTQFGQTNNEHYSIRSSPKLGKSDDSSSNEPFSSQKSSFSTQPSLSFDTTITVPDMNFEEYERQAPDGGEDISNNSQNYTDDYLRSLDGIKNRPLVRDDGSGRRRAFKKRRSSGDSTSSRESRHSREEELKMFTSLEEEEFATMKTSNLDDGTEDFTPIKYSSDPNLKVIRARRHKRSPAKDTQSLDKLGSKSSLEMLDEENINPWGEIKPEHYKDTEFWKREKTNSIEEELDDSSSNWRYIESDIATNECDSGILSTDTLTSPTPKNMPKMSSFEEATHSQHEEAVSFIKRQGSKDAESQNKEIKDNDDKQTGETKNVSSEEICSIASEPLANCIASASAFDQQQTLHETEENVACNQLDDSESHLTGAGLRRSPRMDEIDHYEKRWEHEERRNTQSISPLKQISEETTNSVQTNISLETKTSSIERSITPEIIEVKITYEPIIEYKKTISSDKPATPTIEIDYASDEDTSNNKVSLSIEDDEDDFNEDLGSEAPIDLMAGLSDFYDFNASINPPRSRSASRVRSRSAEPASKSNSPEIKSPEKPFKFIQKSKSPSTSPSIQNVSFKSDFYDFNVNMNKKVYDLPDMNQSQDSHRDANDLKAKNLDYLPSTIKTFETKNDLSQLKEDTNSTSQNVIPLTPDYSRSFSAEWKDVERMKEEMMNNGFKRSTYVGESTDFSDDFEELREKTRHFQRSQSKSRSPRIHENLVDVYDDSFLSKKELQDRILDEITKTTVNYQDFSQNLLTENFLEHERRGSDSALIQKHEILIQFQDDLPSDMEPEEYHHLRRFSLHPEQQIEEYPPDEVVYIDQIEVTTPHGTTEIWQRNDVYTSEDKGLFSEVDKKTNQDVLETILIENFEEQFAPDSDKVTEVNLFDERSEEGQEEYISKEIVQENHKDAEQIHENDHDDDDLEEIDSNSDDDRQTIVEVDDGIDVDTLDYNERNEESYNEQSECEEADRELERQNHNYTGEDWKEEGAVGGILDEEIDHMYDEAMKNRKASGIQRDYDGIVEEISEGDETASNNRLFTQTDDLLDEILKQNAEKYVLSPRQSRASSKDSNRSLIEGERRYLADAVSQSISSTRLRSRYGFAPSTGSYAHFENNDDIDLNYKPKKEYNWRKNFKLDDDNENNNKNSEQNTKFRNSLKNEIDEYDDTENEFDDRKFSLGGESITLFSQSPGNSGDELDDLHEENPNDLNRASERNLIADEHKQDIHKNNNDIICDQQILEKSEFIVKVNEPDLEETEKIPKKKKSKKKGRKGSKGSLGNEDGNLSRRESLFDTETTINYEEEPKRKKKKKKSKDNSIMIEYNKFEQIDNETEKNFENKTVSQLILPVDENISIVPVNSSFIETKSPETSSPSTSKSINKNNEVESNTPRLPSSPNSISVSPDGSKSPHTLDKIDSSDIMELIRDSSILGSSF